MAGLVKIIQGRAKRLKTSRAARLAAAGAALTGLMLAFTPVFPALAANLTVNSTGDQSDENPGNGVCKIAGQNQCTLRAAIEEANEHDGADVISFAGALNGQTIAPTTELPALTASSTTIRGGGNITLDGAPGSLGVGLYIHGGSSNKIQGLTLINFGTAVKIEWGGPGMSLGNFVGTDGNGNADNQEGNVIGNNAANGVLLKGGNVQFTRVAGNKIGVNAAGTAAMPNVIGVRLEDGTTSNIIGTNGDGTADAAERNIISGNSDIGISLSDANSNRIAGNYIGINAAGTAKLGNENYGISIRDGAFGNIIGTNGDGQADSAERNIISGNNGPGVGLGQVTLNAIAGNTIGLNAAGTAPLGNHGPGVGIVFNSFNNRVGTDGNGVADIAERNVISGNDFCGVVLSANNNVVAGNYIGVNAAGTAGIGNLCGVNSGYSNNTRIGTNGDGTADAAERNIISGNVSHGIDINGSDNIVAGNYIGTNAAGTVGIGNGSDGVYISVAPNGGGSNNTVGGNSLAEGNLIAFNDHLGIEIAHSNTPPVGNTILGNSIVSNGGLGIDLADPVSGTVTDNDFGDFDSGPNDLMNGPIMSDATTSGANITTNAYIVDSLPDQTFIVQFYSSPQCEPGWGYGEGKTYLGQKTVTTSSSGYASISASFMKTVPAGDVVTATATANSSTSEFSQCVPVTQFTLQGKISIVKPFYSWFAIQGAESYNLVVTEAAGTTIDARFLAADICLEGVCRVNPDTALREGVPYEWRVRPVTPAGDGNFGKIRKFIVDLTPPDASMLRTPGDGSVVPSTRPRFTWGALPDVMRYQIQIATDPDFLHMVIDTVPAKNRFTPGRSQAFGRGVTYYWRVRAQDRAGNWGLFGSTFSFTVNR